MPYKVSKAEFSRLVEAALESLPEPFARFLEEVPVEIHDLPKPSHTRGLPRRGLLLGLYRGRPQTVRSVEHSGVLPDVIYIFQDNIQQVCHTEDELIEQVRITVLHEIGHHFGMSEEDLKELGYG